jgi:hypothetical protein
MATFNEKYIYSVQVNGAAKSIAQLEQLINLSNQLKTQNIGGVASAVPGAATPAAASAAGANAGRSWGNSFNASVKHAVVNTAVYGSIAMAMGAVVGSAHAWTQANIALSDSLAQLQINLGGTRKAAEDYYWQMQQSAFATGQDVQESVYAKTVEKRINRPGLAQGGMEFGLVFPEVPVQDAIGNILALQIQFGSSFKEINEVLLDTVQASGLTAKELLNLSDTWGPLSQELGMLDAAGNRTTEGMRNISGLMAGMATVMGESGSTIENFLRKMSQFYTNEDLKAFLQLRGIETTSGKTAEGLDIRVPFMELMAQISEQAKRESGFTVGLQGFFPNQLGQPTQQQLQELIRNWDTISGIMAAADDPVREWGEAVEVSSERASVALKRIGDATSGLFAAIGGNENFTSFLNSLAAGIQNQAVRAAGAKEGYAMQGAYDSQSGGIGSPFLVAYSERFNALENFVEKKSGDNLFLQATEQRVKEMLLNLQVPNELAGRKSEASNYAEATIRSFVGSEYFDPKENGALMAQSFLEFLANGWNEQLATSMALGGGGVGAISQSGAATYSTGPLDYTMMPPPRTNIPEAIDTLVESYEVIGSASWLASRSINAMADAADKEYTVMGSEGVTVPEGVTFAEGMKEYTRRMVELADFASTNGVKAGLDITPTTIWGEDGSPFTVVAVDAEILGDAFKYLAQDANIAADALSVLGGIRLNLPEGVTPEAVKSEYDRLLGANTAYAAQTGAPLGFRKADAMLTEGGVPVVTFSDVDKGLLSQAVDNVGDVVTEQERTRNENRTLANQANAQAEARAKRLEGLFNSMFDAITKPTSVTASDLMYNAPGGKYQNKWDEPVRQMRADVNNMIAGKDLEYGFGGGAFSSIFEPGILGFAKGADQDTKAAILKDLQSQAETAFYGMTLSPEAYTGSKDALVAEAQKWVEGKKNEKANKSMMKGWLTEAGLGPEAMGFLDEMDEPPILKMLTGGKTKEEMTTLFGEKIPNVSDSLAKGAEDVAWIAIIAGTITAQVKDDPDPLIGAGQVMGGWLAQGSASAFVAALVPQIIAAVLAGLT